MILTADLSGLGRVRNKMNNDQRNFLCSKSQVIIPKYSSWCDNDEATGIFTCAALFSMYGIRLGYGNQFCETVFDGFANICKGLGCGTRCDTRRRDGQEYNNTKIIHIYGQCSGRGVRNQQQRFLCSKGKVLLINLFYLLYP